MDKVEKRFRELAQNKDITDEELFDELYYIHAKTEIGTRQLGQSCISPVKFHVVETVKKYREINPTLKNMRFSDGDPEQLRFQIRDISQFTERIPSSATQMIENQRMKSLIRDCHFTQIIENYEMKKRIQSLEQTLAAFMEQTKVERLSQEAVMQSLSNELDEFQEEFYDCQSEVKEQKERIELIEETLTETIQIVMERVPFVKDKTD